MTWTRPLLATTSLVVTFEEPFKTTVPVLASIAMFSPRTATVRPAVTSEIAVNATSVGASTLYGPSPRRIGQIKLMIGRRADGALTYVR